jgi:cytoskeletal protein CcmA (bactofilin family)
LKPRKIPLPRLNREREEMDDGSSNAHRNPPPKPKRTHPPLDPEETFSDNEYNPTPARRGRNHQRSSGGSDSPPSTPPNHYQQPQRNAKVPIVDAEPETTIGAAVKMKGQLSFERLLRIEGEFEGTLISKGSLVVGTKGLLIGDIENMKEVYITGGKILGNITVDKLVLRDRAQVHGDITAKSIKVEPDCVVVGKLNVHAQAPERINYKGEVVAKPSQAPAGATPVAARAANAPATNAPAAVAPAPANASPAPAAAAPAPAAVAPAPVPATAPADEASSPST